MSCCSLPIYNTFFLFGNVEDGDDDVDEVKVPRMGTMEEGIDAMWAITIAIVSYGTSYFENP